LAELEETATGPTELLKNWPDGRIKMFVTWKLLQYRRAHAELFFSGEYIPLHVSGVRSDHVIAFARRLHDEWCVVAVPRLYGSLKRAGSPPCGEPVWQNTTVELPEEAPREWTNLLTNERISTAIVASQLFRTLPFGVAAPVTRSDP